MAISDDQYVELIPLLAEAARASQRTTDRFVPPRLGIVEEAGSRRHQLVTGRRGVGKSTLLRTVELSITEEGGVAIFIDLETLRGIPYPDVLIQLLIELFEALDRRLGENRKDLALRKRLHLLWQQHRLGSLAKSFRRLLAEPQAAEHTVRKLRSKSKGGALGLSIPARFKNVGASASGGVDRESSEQVSVEAQFTQTKMEGLHAAASSVRDVLQSVMHDLAGHHGYIILDDFYHIPLQDQPYVLSYLHQIVKNLDIYLKICGVRHRLSPFIEGDPPVGLQVGQDVGTISLDVTLEQFNQAQTFLEKVLAGICKPVNVSVDELITDGGKTRLVLGSGGVARDYLNLCHTALKLANARSGTVQRPHNRINAEDVNEASAELSAEKQNDLHLDSGPNAEVVRERLASLVRFCLDHNQTNVFLVDGAALNETQWGQEIESLADLRLLHEIGNVSIQSSVYRGRRFVAFTLDLSHYTGTRSEHIRQIEFWNAAGRQDIRRAGLIYTPEFENERGPKAAGAQLTEPVNWEEPPLPFDEVGVADIE